MEFPLIPAFYFEPTRLDELAMQHGPSYRAADPFAHVVIDDFLPSSVLQQLVSEFPGTGEKIRWYATENESRYKKTASEKENQLGPFTRHFLQALNSSDFVRFLEKLTGIDSLLTDPHFFGGGIHQTSRGGMLKIHVDNNWDTKLLVFRSLNIILYLNEEWPEEYGGELELWSEDMQRCVRKIRPIANRLVIFYNSEKSLHGHPEPLRCPEGVTRKSIALYYYTVTKPLEEIKKLPHTTIYKRRPGEQFRRRFAGLRVLERFVPPVFMDLFRYHRRRTFIQQRTHA